MKDAITVQREIHEANVAAFETLQEKKERDINELIFEVISEPSKSQFYLELDQGASVEFTELFLNVAACESNPSLEEFADVGKAYIKYLKSKIREDFETGDLSEYGE